MVSNPAHKPVTFDTRGDLLEIILAGAGGTGSKIARNIAMMLYDMKAHHQQIPTFRIVDFDEVEPSNIGRQLYSPKDLGKPKSRVIATRLNLALGLEIQWDAAPFDPDLHTRNISARSAPLIIGAVDNHLARQTIAKAEGALILDCGNFNASGQVVFGNTSKPDQVFNSLEQVLEGKADHISFLPNFHLLFPELLQPDPFDTSTQGLSCAELIEQGQQHLLINGGIAQAASVYVYMLLHRQPIPTFLSFVDLDSISMRSTRITRAALESYLNLALQNKQS